MALCMGLGILTFRSRYVVECVKILDQLSKNRRVIVWEIDDAICPFLQAY